MSDTEKYEVHPGITGYTPQEPKYEVHPELAAQPVQENQQQEQIAQSTDHEHTDHDHDHEHIDVSENNEPVKEVETKNNSVKQSWNDLRTAKERAEYERDFLLKQLAQYENMQQGSKQASAPKPQEPDEDYSVNVNPDDLVEGKHLSKVDKKLRKLENELKQYQQKAQQATTEALLRAQYPDFEKVASRENIDLLRMQYPEIAATLNANTDLYNTAVSAYTLIKKLGIHKEDLFVADRERAQKNAAKPKPLASISPQKAESPLSHANAFANGLTQDLSKNLWKEMQEAMKKS